MERGSKRKFQMKSSALRAEETILGRFMAMGKTLGNSKSSKNTTVDFTKHYKAPSKKEEVKEEKPETASQALKRRKAENELIKMDAINGI
tara:strand:- start:214 stop:483 length:270 start_codon:yes stop_codon:yes gene_type:complete